MKNHIEAKETKRGDCLIVLDWRTALLPVCDRNQLKPFLTRLAEIGKVVVLTESKAFEEFVDSYLKSSGVDEHMPEIVRVELSAKKFKSFVNTRGFSIKKSVYVQGDHAPAATFAVVCENGVRGLALVSRLNGDEKSPFCRVYSAKRKKLKKPTWPFFERLEAMKGIKTPTPF